MKLKETLDLEYTNCKLERLDLQHRLQWAIDEFGPDLTLASSLGPQSIVLTCMMRQLVDNPDIFFLDTGRLPAETYELLNECMDHFDIKYRIFFPDNQDIEEYIHQFGPNGFYQSVQQRKSCCEIRKLKSMKRALTDYSIWITGTRRDQNRNRRNLEILQWDHRYHLYKFNPMVDWTAEMVWDYIKTHNLPYNSLHDQGYPSIGCAPCTRATQKGEDPRAGRWWWEEDGDTECGMHVLSKPSQEDLVQLLVPDLFDDFVQPRNISNSELSHGSV